MSHSHHIFDATKKRGAAIALQSPPRAYASKSQATCLTFSFAGEQGLSFATGRQGHVAAGNHARRTSSPGHAGEHVSLALPSSTLIALVHSARFCCWETGKLEFASPRARSGRAVGAVSIASYHCAFLFGSGTHGCASASGGFPVSVSLANAVPQIVNSAGEDRGAHPTQDRSRGALSGRAQLRPRRGGRACSRREWPAASADLQGPAALLLSRPCALGAHSCRAHSLPCASGAPLGAWRHPRCTQPGMEMAFRKDKLAVLGTGLGV